MSLLQLAATSLVDFVAKHSLPIPHLYLIDCGVSGGLNTVWRKWGCKLSALGIDSLESEIETLSKNENNTFVKYVATCLTAPEKPSRSKTQSNYNLHKTLAYLATFILSNPVKEKTAKNFIEIWQKAINGQLATVPLEASYRNVDEPLKDHFIEYYTKRFNRGEKIKISKDSKTLDAVLSENVNFSQIDVLKIDTDGTEFDILRGAEKTLFKTLAVEIEVQFHGIVSETSNTFCNIDSFLRNQGFTLFKLEPAMYSRSALPKPFKFEIPAQNTSGQIMWADALYVHEARIRQDNESRRSFALIFDLYGLEDAAAELLLETPGLFDGEKDEKCLDFLAKKIYGSDASYIMILEKFISNPIGKILK